jgi:hypothetical protein
MRLPALAAALALGAAAALPAAPAAAQSTPIYEFRVCAIHQAGYMARVRFRSWLDDGTTRHHPPQDLAIGQDYCIRQTAGFQSEMVMQVYNPLSGWRDGCTIYMPKGQGWNVMLGGTVTSPTCLRRG